MLIELKRKRDKQTMKVALSMVLMMLVFSVATCNLHAKGKLVVIVQTSKEETGKDFEDSTVYNETVETLVDLYISTYGKEVNKHLRGLMDQIQLIVEDVNDMEKKKVFIHDLYRDVVQGFKLKGFMEYTDKEKAEKGSIDSKTGLIDYNMD